MVLIDQYSPKLSWSSITSSSGEATALPTSAHQSAANLKIALPQQPAFCAAEDHQRFALGVYSLTTAEPSSCTPPRNSDLWLSDGEWFSAI